MSEDTPMEPARAFEDDIRGVPRDAIIEEYLPLAKMVAAKIAARLPSSVERNDLISAGVIGLIDAIDKYDAEKSNSFRKYAEIRIRGAILDELRSMDWVSRTVRRQSARLDLTQRKLRRDLGREATDDEVAKELGVSLEEYHQVLHKLQPILLLSFEDLGVNDEGERRSLTQFLRDPKAIDPGVAVHFRRLREVVAEQVENLPEKQRIVITLYYFDSMNLKEIGKVLDVTESRVSQLHAQAVKTLKAKIRRHFTKKMTENSAKRGEPEDD
jgi:RNA polymerase sigma factor for flagellar operon FliA